MSFVVVNYIRKIINMEIVIVRYIILNLAL